MEWAVCGSTGALTSMRDEWDSLVHRCARSTVFQTWEWNYAWWQEYCRSNWKARFNAQLHVVSVRDGGELVGLLPLWRSRRRKAVRFIGEHATDYLMPLLAPGREDEVAGVLWSHVRSLSKSNAVELIDVPSDHPFAQLASGDERREGSVCPRIELPPSAQTLLEGISSNLRHSIRKGDREIIQSGRGVFCDAGDSDGAAAYDRFEALYALRAQVKGLDRALADPYRAAFWRRFCSLAAPKGILRLKLLEIDGSPACGVLCFHFKGVTSYYAQGMDPGFSSLAPGNLTLWRAVEDACSEGAVVFDFLRGEEEFKARWRPTLKGNVDLVLSQGP